MVSAQTFTVEFTRTELDAALAKGTNGKAPGLDGVTHEMITNISPNAKDVLLKFLNRTWTNGVLPRAWQTAVLVPMLKKGKNAKATSSYRSISLTSQNVASKTRLAYADDLVLWQHSTDVEHAADALNRDLALLKHYCAHSKMSINTTKTVYSVFSNSNLVLAQDLDIKVGKVSLQRDNQPIYSMSRM
ncbi:hypothetical protein PoB_007504300 [Plakobranchus ocellatus]|uniref:Reverse transcriptase domain-containing protein n=1 Tax=Plakobranchus ocellatus TaxID=259542 RepID=A0AAV4DVX0_9GAST|nr:hypothetical protein PoB_007504300 [Plakobranchus ocellatus]